LRWNALATERLAAQDLERQYGDAGDAGDEAVALACENNALHARNNGLWRRLTDAARDNGKLRGAVGELLAERLSISLKRNAAERGRAVGRGAPGRPRRGRVPLSGPLEGPPPQGHRQPCQLRVERAASLMRVHTMEHLQAESGVWRAALVDA